MSEENLTILRRRLEFLATLCWEFGQEPDGVGATKTEVLNRIARVVEDTRKSLSAATAEAEALKKRCEGYEAILVKVDRISSYKPGREWELLLNNGIPGSPNVGKWFFRHDIDTFYDSPLEAFQALTAANNEEIREGK